MKSPFLILAGGLLTGCAAQPLAPVAADASDPAAATRPIAYQPVVAGYTPGRPVEPGDWLDLNRQVSPEAAQ